MKKNVILIVAGAVDAFLSNTSKKAVDKQDKLLANIKDLLVKNNYKAVMNLTSFSDTKATQTTPFKSVPNTKLVNYVLQSDSFNHSHNRLSITTQEGDAQYFDGHQFDYLFPAEEYEVHVCGVDVHGVLKDTISTLIKLGYHVTTYSDVLRPFKNTHKYINTLSKNTSFTYC